MNNQLSALEHLAELELAAKRQKYLNVPAFALVKPLFSDKTANELTKAIIRCIELHGGYATRIQSQGQFNERLSRWTKGTTRRGTADVHAIINGLHLGIEVKIAKDRLSAAQEATAVKVQAAGGIYFFAKDYETFWKWFCQIIRKGSTSC